MIFVVLGTQKFQLNRLLQELDFLIERGKIQEEVYAQIGNSDYIPRHYTYERFLDKETFEQVVAQARLVITHSGVGSIISALNAGKKVIVYPRLAKYAEHVDDHQLDIARAFEKKQYVLCCYEGDHLLDCIKRSEFFDYQKYVSQRERIITIVKEYITTGERKTQYE